MNYALLITTAINAVKTVEQLMPDSTGKEKADAAIALVEGILGEVQAILPGLLSLFTTVVNGLRAAGVFKVKTPAA